ncbi:hypothetical protein [Alkalihalobacillus sp. TS-13]|uniref:hypothetical protein n=1 Tax=Alkalihalobacillus sp. TS-13 TaxID=2842455 RepID=UPI001C868115|nr:hypothetical protein [Alkalihalobacillus sp. TS-13]
MSRKVGVCDCLGVPASIGCGTIFLFVLVSEKGGISSPNQPCVGGALEAFGVLRIQAVILLRFLGEQSLSSKSERLSAQRPPYGLRGMARSSFHPTVSCSSFDKRIR